MKTEQPILIASIEVNQDTPKHFCVGTDGSIPDEGMDFLGVCNADTLDGEQAPVMVSGIALCFAEGIIDRGSKVLTFDNGSVVASSGTTFTPDHVGIALDGAAATGDIIRVLLR